MRKFLRCYFVSDFKWLFWTVLTLIVFTNFYSVKSRVTPEPGVALSIYSSYDAMMRVGGIDTIGFEAAPQYRSYLENEVEQMVGGKETCSKMLKDPNKTCQASNIISASERLQHWKSYLLPSVLAASAFDKNAIAEIRKFDSTKPSKPYEPSPKLYRDLRANGIIFFGILLAIKALVWFLVWFGSRRLLTRFVASGVFILTAIWGLLVDFVFRRGAGVYALDRLIAGSSRFDASTSVNRAVPLAIFDLAKAVIAPSPSTSLFGITPRSVVIFIAVMMMIAVMLERSWKFLILVPIGLGVHFTTFAVLLALLAPSLLYILVSGRTRERIHIPISIALSLPVIWLQVRDRQPGHPEFSFWAAFVFFFIVTALVPIVVLTERNKAASDSRDTKVLTRSSMNTIVLVLAMFTALTTYSIWRLARTYGFSDSSGFWTDGFLREGAGRAAPLLGSLAVFLPLTLLAIKFDKPRGWFGSLVSNSGDNSQSTSNAVPAHRFFQLFGLCCVVLLTSYLTRGLFL